MNQEVMNEIEFVSSFQENNLNEFFRFIKRYEAYIEPILRVKGYEYVKKAERTVSFTFGDITFSRKCFRKGKDWVYPIDEKLGLEKYERCSKELLLQIVKLATMLPYRKVVEVIEMMYHVFITKDTVLKAVKFASKLLKEKDDYRYYDDELHTDKLPVDVLYIEGDGVMVKSCEQSNETRHVDLAHFIVHTGSKRTGKKRYELQNKREIISSSNVIAQDKLKDLLYNDYEISEDTVLITNSDMGKGYTPHVFKELAKLFQVKRHEHLWDSYHLNLKIDDQLKDSPYSLKDSFYKAIQAHSKKQLRTCLDTLESLTPEDGIEKFSKFKRRLLNNFQYTKPAQKRGFSHTGIGVMESSHRKITYRMKKRGMYWSNDGAETISRLIILAAEKGLRNLFFGDWREKYAHFVNIEKFQWDEARREYEHLGNIKPMKPGRPLQQLMKHWK